MCITVPEKVRRGVRSLGTEVTDSCEPPWRCWESNPSPLQEQTVLLATELSLQPQHYFFMPHGDFMFNYMHKIKPCTVVSICVYVYIFASFSHIKFAVE